MFSKQNHHAATSRSAQFEAPEEPSLDRRADDLAAKRTELTAKLGALIYEQTKTNPQARRGREVLYDGIAEVDRELENLEREREHLAQLATPAGHAFCPFCGKQVSAAAVFCPQCGTRLTSSEAPARAATLTDQLEELDLEEPDFDATPFYGAADASAAAAGFASSTTAAAMGGASADASDAGGDAPAAEDGRLATTAGTSGVPAKLKEASTTANADVAEADDLQQNDDGKAAGAQTEDSTADANSATDDVAAEEGSASLTGKTAVIADDTASLAGEKATDEADTAAGESEGNGNAADADPASVLYSSRRDGIADALAPAADSVSAFHLAPQIIREAQADLTPEDEFTPASFPDPEDDLEATRVLPVVTIEDAKNDNANFDPDSFGFDDSFTLDDEFDRELAKREAIDRARRESDPDATQVLPTAVVEASSFENDATEVLPGIVDDAPDFKETDATRIMTAIPDDGDHYEPDPLQRTYRSF